MAKSERTEEQRGVGEIALGGYGLRSRNQVNPAATEGKQTLERALDHLEQLAPDRVCRVIRWLRNPKARLIRLPLGVLLILLSFLWFLPVIGIELLPLGLMLVAIDVPPLQGPVGRGLLWLERRWVRYRAHRV